MANRSSFVSASVYKQSLDGRWYTQYPYGTAIPGQAQLQAELSSVSSIKGTLGTGILLASSLAAPMSIQGSLNKTGVPGAALQAALQSYNTILGSLTVQPQAYYDGDISVNGAQWINGAGLNLSSSLQGVNLSGLETSAAQGYADWYGQNMAPVMALASTWAINCVRIPLNAASFLAGTTMPGLTCRNLNNTGTGWNGPARSPDPNGTYVNSVDTIVALAQYYGCYVWFSGHWSAPTFKFTGDTVPVQAMPLGQPPFIDALLYQMWLAVGTRYCSPSSPPITVPLQISSASTSLITTPNLSGALTIGASSGGPANPTVWNAGSATNNGQGNNPADSELRGFLFLRPGFTNPLVFSTTPWNMGAMTGLSGYNAQTNQVQVNNPANATPTSFAWTGNEMAFWIDSDDAPTASATNPILVSLFSEWDSVAPAPIWANGGGTLTMGAQFQFQVVSGGPYNKMSLQFLDPAANVYLGIAAKVLDTGAPSSIGFLVSGSAAGRTPIYQLSVPIGYDTTTTKDSTYTGNTYTPSQFLTTTSGTTQSGATPNTFQTLTVTITPAQFKAWITWANLAATAAGGTAAGFPPISTDITTYLFRQFHTNNEISATGSKSTFGHVMKGFALSQNGSGPVDVTLSKNAIVLELMNEPFLDTMNGYGEPPNAACTTAMGGTPNANGTYSPTTISYWYSSAYNWGAAQATNGDSAVTVNQSWQAYGYNQVGQALRALGIQNIIQCNGCGYANAPSTYARWIFNDSLVPPQVAVGQHTYSDTVYAYGEKYPNVLPDAGSGGANWHVAGTDAVLAANIALAYTEDGGYGGPQCTQTPAEPHTNYLIPYAQSRGIPYFAWTFWPSVTSSGQTANANVTNYLLQDLTSGVPTQGQGAITYAAYTNTSVAVPPTITPAQSSNTYTAPITIGIASPTPGAYIAYTLDGSTPIPGVSPGGASPLSFTLNPPSTGTQTTVTALTYVPTGGYSPSGTSAVTYTFGSAPGLMITTVLPSQLTQNQAISPIQQTSSGGVGTVTWGKNPTGLPTGLTETTAGVISGTPTGATTYNWTQTAQDSSTPTPQTASAAQSIQVVAAGTVPTLVQLLLQGQTFAGQGDLDAGDPDRVQPVNPNYAMIGWQGLTSATSYNIYRATIPVGSQATGTLNYGTTPYASITAAAAATKYSGYVSSATGSNVVSGINCAWDSTAETNCCNGTRGASITGTNGSNNGTLSPGDMWAATGYSYKVSAIVGGVETALSAAHYAIFIANGQKIMCLDSFNDGAVNYAATDGGTTPSGNTKTLKFSSNGGSTFYFNPYAGNGSTEFNMNARAFNYVELNVKANQAGDLQIVCENEGDNYIIIKSPYTPATVTEVYLSSYATFVVGEYVHFKIPLADIATDVYRGRQNAFYKFGSLTAPYGQTTVWWIDDWKFTT